MHKDITVHIKIQKDKFEKGQKEAEVYLFMPPTILNQNPVFI